VIVGSCTDPRRSGGESAHTLPLTTDKLSRVPLTHAPLSRALSSAVTLTTAGSIAVLASTTSCGRLNSTETSGVPAFEESVLVLERELRRHRR